MTVEGRAARLLRAWFLPVSLLLLGVAAFLAPLPFYLESPGELVPLADAVEVPDGDPIEGNFFLTTVNFQVATPLLLALGVVDDDIEVLPKARVVPSGVPPAEYFAAQRQLFLATGDVAAAVALEAAGYEVPPPVGEGAFIVRVLPDTPAVGVLRAGDVVIAVDDQPVRTAEQLREALGGSPREHEITFVRGDETVEGTVTPQLVQVGAEQVPLIGVEVETLQPRIDLPVPVEVRAGPIGGPSAGLMVALTVYDKVLEEVDLARGREIGGTGTIDAEGHVGPIGGITQKVLTAAEGGADIFLVPEEQLQEAADALGPDALAPGAPLRLLGVSTFTDAVTALRAV